MMPPNEQVAIQINGLRKQYRLGVFGYGSLRKDLESWWARLRGHEDPNAILGRRSRLEHNTFWALNGIDLTIRQGERIGIIGVNGAGKSTLLKILCRITAPTEGDIDIYGRINSMLEIGTGFHREMTGRENIYMNGAILGMSQAEIDAKLADIIEFSEVGEFIDTPVKRYSSGMFVKLAFAVAAHLESEIVIMDEVLAVGDMSFQQKCLDKMRELSDEQGRTVLYVSHNMATIRRLCSRCIVLKEGRIIYDGDVETAIAVYMDSGVEPEQRELSLDSRMRVSERGNCSRMLRTLRLEDPQYPGYSSGDFINMTFGLTVDAPRNDLRLLVRVLTQDGMVLGTALTDYLDLKKTDYQELNIRMPLGALTKGCFYVNIGLCRTPAPDRFVFVEYGENIFKFQVESATDWNCVKSGYCRFPELDYSLK